MRKRIQIFCFLLFVTSFGFSQNCYKTIADLTGLPITSNLSELQDSSCALIQKLPQEFQSQFKVYDFGFYPLNEYTQGGFSEFWNIAINEAKSETPYYLIFGRQLPDSKGKAKIWVEINLPNTGSFSCIDDIAPGFRSSLTSKIRTVAEIEFAKSSNLPNSFVEAELKSISILKKFVANIVSCCDPPGLRSNSCTTCLFTSDEVTAYLTQNDFIKIPITLADTNKLTNFDCGINSTAMREKNDPKYNSNRSTSSIINYTDYNINLDGASVNIETLVTSTLGTNGVGDFKVYIMDYDNIINNTFYEKIDEVRAKKGGLIYFIDNYSTQSYLYISPTALDVNLQFEQAHLEDYAAAANSSNSCEGCPDWMLEIYNQEYSESASPLVATVIAPAIPLAAVDGPLPVADAIIAAAAAAAITYELTQRVYLTYIAYNPNLNLHYSGRTSGFGTPEAILYQRISSHHAISKGYIVDLDKSMQVYPMGYWCTRGREQQNIDYYGGALTESNRPSNATSSNKIRGVAKYNPFGGLYHWASSTAWGEKHPYTGYGSADAKDLWEKLKQFKRMQDWLKF
jgi:hypothetical protein